MALTTGDETTQQEKFEEKTCREITASEKKRQQIRERGGIGSRRQKLALSLGGAQVLSYIALCIPLWVYKSLTLCPIQWPMIVVYVIIFIALIGHIMLIFTAIRKLQPGGLWIPMAVQIAIVALSSVQLFLMVNLFAKVSQAELFDKELCNSQMSNENYMVASNQRQTHLIAGSGTCLFAFALGVAGFITNLLLYFELNKDKTDEDNEKNRLILERQQNRIAVLHDMIRLQERRNADAANEAIKTAKEEPVAEVDAGAAGQTPAGDTAPNSTAAKSKHRMI